MPRNHDDAPAHEFDSLLRQAVEISDPTLPAHRARPLLPGDVLAERFVIERVVGSGGMGTVHRALDLSTQQAVAIKVLSAASEEDTGRFAQEAAVLAALPHGAIVRYVAHGTTPLATPFLAMEWLDGEDLAQRLARAPLSASESLALLRRACAGVAMAHAHGIIHRDLKPSNLFLPSRNPAELKVLDFGIARQTQQPRFLTQSGVVLGTVGYMAPEQAMGQHELDSRADVFALGCVLFECLTGRAAFTGPNAMAVLAKVLCEEPARVSELRPGLGEALDALVARLLSKDPKRRPPDAAAVLHLLEELDHTRGGLARPGGVGPAEQKIVSVVLGRPRSCPPASSAEPDVGSIRELLRRFGAEPVPMLGGGLLIVFSGLGAATDQASQAASCALLLAHERPDLCVAVATGRAQTAGRVPVGAAIDGAAQLLAAAYERPESAVVDELTAALLEPAFEVERSGSQLVLAGKRSGVEAFRLLMGKATPFVGRNKELALLELTLRESIDESVARAVLVTGPPGQGKSRLRHEFVTRARAIGNVRIMIARADPIGDGSARLLARQLLHEAVRPPSSENLRRYIATVCGAENGARIADFLGELIGSSASEEPCPELRAARNDPQIMRFWLRRSFVEWLAAECASGPVLLVLEDLHWGDVASLEYVFEAFRALETRPLMVLGLARPEGHETFSNLWGGAELQRIALGRLTTQSAERLVRAVLDQQLDADAVARIVERSDGNAFYLEELIRHAGESGSESMPDTVIALVQSRIGRLPPELRRVVRAASIFGAAFRRDALAALLQPRESVSDIDGWLEGLREREVIATLVQSGVAGQVEYAFRHSMLRDAAYALLTDADRVTGHANLGHWLEHAGERDALTLANHFERGALAARAVPWLLRAAQVALDAGDIAGALLLADRGIRCGAAEATLGSFHLIRMNAHTIRGEWREAIESSQAATAQLPAAGQGWFSATAGALLAGTCVPDSQAVAKAVRTVMKSPAPARASGPYGLAIFFAIQGLTQTDQIDAASALLARAESAAADGGDPLCSMWLHDARATLQLRQGDLGAALASVGSAGFIADRAHSVLGRATAAMLLVAVLCQTGHVERIVAGAREVRACSGSIGLRALTDWVSLFLVCANVDLDGQPLGPLRLKAAIHQLLERKDYRLVSAVRNVLAFELLRVGDVEAAERESMLALEGAVFPSDRAEAMAIRALVELALDRPKDALVLAEQGLGVSPSGTQAWDGSLLYLARARALHALQRMHEAHDAIRQARERLTRIAATLPEAELRDAYFELEPNRRTLQLAREWLAEALT